MTAASTRYAAGALVLAGMFAGQPQMAVAAAPAAATKGTTCKIDISLALRPGIGLQPGRSSFASRGGQVTCDGPVLGRKVTGPGTYSSDGRIGTEDPDSCTSGGEGWGVWMIRFPTAKGTYTYRNPFTFTYGAVTRKGVLSGEVQGDYGDATFSIIPTKGDCVTKKVTRSRVTATIAVHPYRAP